ncbi:MAG: elongation factor 1-beta [Candidatus Woesearchaeota archaeon]
MANVIITMKIMPESPETDLEALKEKAKKMIADFGGEVGKEEIEPVAFGLKAINLIFVSDENKGSTEELEKQVSDIEEVTSVEITDVRRAVG